jgi:hypothetical protein
MIRILRNLWAHLQGRDRFTFRDGNCGHVDPDEGACIWPTGHRGRHWHSMFGAPKP